MLHFGGTLPRAASLHTAGLKTFLRQQQQTEEGTNATKHAAKHVRKDNSHFLFSHLHICNKIPPTYNRAYVKLSNTSSSIINPSIQVL